MAYYISREDAINALLNKGQRSKRYKLGKTWELNLMEITEAINSIPPEDVQPVVDTENMATVSDEFICKKCGIYLKDYIKVVMDEDNDGYIDERHYEYEPKFCPECGAKVKDGDTECHDTK